MNHHYRDIRDRIPEVPTWFDENAVPRYSQFSPDETANIYADEVALVLIQCQSCGHAFNVAFSSDSFGRFRRGGETIEKRIRDKSLHYGDPPNVECCAAGPTMNSIPLRVMGYWKRNGLRWIEGPKELLADITPQWVNDDRGF